MFVAMRTWVPSHDGRTPRYFQPRRSAFRSVSMSRGTEASRGTPEGGGGRAAATATADPARDAAGGAGRKGRKRVLVVDDEKDLVDLIGYNLQRNGYDAVSAYDGNTAIELATREPPDLIVLDLMLPGLDGTEVARRLKSDSRTQHVPIVMLPRTASSSRRPAGRSRSPSVRGMARSSPAAPSATPPRRLRHRRRPRSPGPALAPPRPRSGRRWSSRSPTVFPSANWDTD
jgi:CheY-like chemotaxis protein